MKNLLILDNQTQTTKHSTHFQITIFPLSSSIFQLTFYDFIICSLNFTQKVELTITKVQFYVFSSKPSIHHQPIPLHTHIHTLIYIYIKHKHLSPSPSYKQVQIDILPERYIFIIKSLILIQTITWHSTTATSHSPCLLLLPSRFLIGPAA